MNGYERSVAMMEGGPVDCLPLLPITMMFAADQIGVKYGEYASDHRKLVEAQLVTAERFGFDYVSCISDPAREAADCGAAIQFFDDQPPAVDENNALLADKSRLVGLKTPDPLGGGRMYDRVQAAALFREKVGGDLLIEGWIEAAASPRSIFIAAYIVEETLEMLGIVIFINALLSYMRERWPVISFCL